MIVSYFNCNISSLIFVFKISKNKLGEGGYAHPRQYYKLSCLEGRKHDFRFLDFKNTIVYLCILIDSQKSECKKSCYQQDTAKKMMYLKQSLRRDQFVYFGYKEWNVEESQFP